MNTIVLDDIFDSSISFFTGNFDGNNSPIKFIDSSSSCGLSFNFDSYASNTDDINFFTATDTPITSITPDIDGYDTAIRKITLMPKGVFNTNAGVPPNCSFSYKVRIT